MSETPLVTSLLLYKGNHMWQRIIFLLIAISWFAPAVADQLELSDKDRLHAGHHLKHKLEIDPSGLVVVSSQAKSTRLTGFKSKTIVRLLDRHENVVAILVWDHWSNPLDNNSKGFVAKISAEKAARVRTMKATSYYRHTDGFEKALKYWLDKGIEVYKATAK